LKARTGANISDRQRQLQLGTPGVPRVAMGWSFNEPTERRCGHV
jgi:hypothetical protein